jgi:hypothetical protein
MASQARVAGVKPDRTEELIVALAEAALQSDDGTARKLMSRLMRPGRNQRPLAPEVVRRLGQLVADYDREGPVKLEARRQTRASSPRRIATPPPALLMVAQPTAVEPVLPPSILEAFDQLVLEHQRSEELVEHSLSPSTKLLLTGEPGVGKTLSASYLAQRLDLPLAAIDPATVMSSLLGESARNLREALTWCRRNPCVVLIDEFDAFAKRRDDATDVGELKRLVNMLLLELDNWSPNRLLVAATNHPQLLDRAVERRFDLKLELPTPNSPAREAIIGRLLTHHHASVSQDAVRLLAATTEGMTGSDLAALVTGAIRRGVLKGSPLEHELLEPLHPPMSKGRAETRIRAAYCVLAHDVGGFSNRDIARRLGLSNASVSALVRAGRAMDGTEP